MLTAKRINELFVKYDVSPSKRFGQNFLIDNNIINKIIIAASIHEKDVVEIGPGLGSLTFPLLSEVKSLVSYEIDKEMINVLQNEIKDDKFTLIENDFLKEDFSWQNKKTIVANIPYNITSDILFKVFENCEKFDRAIIMIQKEVAERLLAKTKDSNYGKLTVTTSHFADVKKITIVKPSSFLPAPKVDSMVVELIFKENNWANSIKFVNFIKICFSQQRKALFNNLKNTYEKEKILEVLGKLNLPATIRPQELDYLTLTKLFDYIEN